jgi:hypothetical protein
VESIALLSMGLVVTFAFLLSLPVFPNTRRPTGGARHNQTEEKAMSSQNLALLLDELAYVPSHELAARVRRRESAQNSVNRGKTREAIFLWIGNVDAHPVTSEAIIANRRACRGSLDFGGTLLI